MRKRLDIVYCVMAFRGLILGVVGTLYATGTFFTVLEFVLIAILAAVITVPIINKQYRGIDDTTIH